MKKFIIAASLSLALSLPAHASGNHTPPNPPQPAGPQQVQGQAQGQFQGQYQKAYGGQGGAGGAGGQGGVGHGGQGGNSLSRGGDQTQGQQTYVSNVGNTSYTPSAASAYSMAYGQFCIGAVGAGVQPPMMLPGVSFSITWMRDLCRWGHIAEMREKVGDGQGAEWARCQISEYAEADKNGNQQCPQNRSKTSAPAAMPSSAPAVITSRAPVCYAADGSIVPVGQRGAVRCE